MKKTHYYCDICGEEIWESTKEKGYLAKRIMGSIVNNQARRVEIELSVRINGWSEPIDICWECGDVLLQENKRKLSFEVVGEK